MIDEDESRQRYEVVNARDEIDGTESSLKV